ncbi:uncharacterized protein LOC110446747 [Mizuhopecten yessoensis]|uniref:Uncharacterized protein n=1 Tax=Mizuhopecten yessoensis TaxID=6573 RepID=A0A210QWU0_MIZYE|nr:uncharacterized protein LOC110446747 [Mizuhopecten yessoensis]XP_021347720.1 uncharacterized protein LOC110446747 [Mizuhopecten yessoensis]XP_021347721.1 uncharacterized protein LOC110446747 [Mizuhopecten yessoensis]OWF53184.1 hypothetical protein KP79_PYT17453 [Mizuhopecten yessoensis]
MNTLNVGKVDQSKMFIELLNDDEDENAIHDIRRRGSNVSLSRYRSCPQLLDELNLNKGQMQSFESTADDSARLVNKLSPQSPVPLMRRHFQFDQNGMPGSATPTPPSTPQSRRSVHSQRDSPSTPVQGSSPVSTPRLLHRPHLSRPSLSRDSSADSQNDSRNGVHSESRNNLTHVPFTEDMAKRHEHASSTTVTASPLKPGVARGDGTEVTSFGGHRKLSAQLNYLGPSIITGDPSTECSQDKCEKWLQSLHLSKPDKIKSRSHIQLPPI